MTFFYNEVIRQSGVRLRLIVDSGSLRLNSRKVFKLYSCKYNTDIYSTKQNPCWAFYTSIRSYGK